VRPQLLAPLDGGRDGRQVQSGGEVVAMREQHADAQAGIVVEQGVRFGQLAEHARREAVALGGPVDADQQQGVPALGGDGALGGRHGVFHEPH
jgi:hypothetical protein